MGCWGKDNEDFEFAQEAVRLGASDYLLKPVNFVKLDLLIKKLRDAIFEEKQTSRYYRDLEKIFQNELPYIRSKFVNDLVHGRIRTRYD